MITTHTVCTNSHFSSFITNSAQLIRIIVTRLKPHINALTIYTIIGIPHRDIMTVVEYPDDDVVPVWRWPDADLPRCRCLPHCSPRCRINLSDSVYSSSSSPQLAITADITYGLVHVILIILLRFCSRKYYLNTVILFFYSNIFIEGSRENKFCWPHNTQNDI